MYVFLEIVWSTYCPQNISMCIIPKKDTLLFDFHFKSEVIHGRLFKTREASNLSQGCHLDIIIDDV